MPIARRQKSISSAEQQAEHERNAACSRKSREAAMLLLQKISWVSSKAVITGNPPHAYPLNRSVMLLTKSVRDRGNPPCKKQASNCSSNLTCRAFPRPMHPFTAKKKPVGFFARFLPHPLNRSSLCCQFVHRNRS